MTVPKRPKFKQCDKFAEAFRSVINAMSRTDLRRAKRELSWMTNGNVGWLTYRLRDVIREVVEDKLRQTDRRRRQFTLPL
jgi:hypothetical protein